MSAFLIVSLSNASTIDFGLDIISVLRNGKWEFSAKRDRLNGKKKVWRCRHCFIDYLTLETENKVLCPYCGKEMTNLLTPLIKNGEIVREIPKSQEIRQRLLKEYERLPPLLKPNPKQ